MSSLQQPHPHALAETPADPHHDPRNPYKTGLRFDGHLPVAAGQDLWVFGYGSLMWNPGFSHDEQVRGLIRGYHRRFCVISTRYRGTPDKPGLVLGLAPGGSCRGLLFRVPSSAVRATVDYLYEREMVGDAYRPVILPALSERHGVVRAYTFVCRRDSEAIKGKLCADSTADMIAEASGLAGSNRDYLAYEQLHPAFSYQCPRR